MPPKSTDSVPKSMLARYEEITRATDEFCHTRLDEEYAEICRRIAAALCRKRPSPVAQGNITHWIAGIIHAAGLVNLLWDPNEKPYMRAADIAVHFGIGNGTTVARSKVIQRALGLGQLDPRYCRRSLLKDNPYVWFIQMENGVLIDARTQSRTVQEVLVDAGMIPFVWEAPQAGDEPSPTAARPQPRDTKAKAPQPEDPNQGKLFG
jgi:hypothetical protein